MLKKLLTMVIGLGAIAMVIMPSTAKAENTVTLSDSNGLTDITDAVIDKDGEHSDAEEVFFILCDGTGFTDCADIADGTEYELTFTITGDDAEDGPVMVMTMGADIDNDNSWSYTYDEEALEGTLTVPMSKQTFYDESGQEMSAVGVNMAFAVAHGEDGPPIEMLGSYLATTVMNFQMIPPSPGNPYFGFSVTGAQGTSGFIHFLIPVDLIELLSYYEYGDYTSIAAEDMAVFDDDSQVSGNVTELDDGSALVEVDVEFTASKTAQATMIASTSSVTKTITAKEKLPLSLSVRKTSLKKGKKVRGYGWTKRAKKGDKIKIYRKKKGKKKYKKIKVVTTEANGYFTFKDKRAKKGVFFYKAKYKNAKNKVKKSDKLRVKIKK